MAATSPNGNGAAGGPPPGMGLASAHHEIAMEIGQQVEQMILGAKRQNETKVGAEIQKLKVKMDAMDEKIKMATERVNRLDPVHGAIFKADLQKSIEKLEEVWEGEVSTLKHELWQTIQAHNHNADLMKHHKDAIDQIQVSLEKNVPNPELEHIHSQLLQVDRIMQKEQAKQTQVDQFMQRLTIVQQQLASYAAGSAGWGAGGPAGMPGMPQRGPYPQAAAAQPPGLASGAVPPAFAAQAAAAKKKPKASRSEMKNINAGLKNNEQKGKRGQDGGAGPTLRAEAAEFVPMGG